MAGFSGVRTLRLGLARSECRGHLASVGLVCRRWAASLVGHKVGHAVIREALWSELDVVSKLRSRAFVSYRFREKDVFAQLKMLLEKKLVNCFVMVAEDLVVGTVDVFPLGRELYLGNLAIHENFRRHGLARSLVVCTMQDARSRGAERVYLHVSRDNIAAIRLYRELGFVRSFNDEFKVAALPRPPLEHLLFVKELLEPLEPVARESVSPEHLV